MSTLPVTYADVLAASERLRGHAHRTPVLTSRTADERTGARLFFKCENFQRMGAFKFRGAFNALSRFTPEQRRRGVVAFSSGNHAQAVALAGKILGIPATIVMPDDAPASKLAATRGYGAEVVIYQREREDRDAIGRRLAQERGMTLVPPYDHPDVVAGQGTAAKELIEHVGALDVLFVCVGGGGLIAGCALAAAALSPGCRVLGVEPEAGNDAQRSMRERRIVEIPVPKTIADGARTTHVGEITLPIMLAHVADILTATDAELVECMRFFAQRMKIVVEPTGCLGAAAAFSDRVDIRDRKVGVIVSGGNVDLDVYARLLGAPPAAG